LKTTLIIFSLLFNVFFLASKAQAAHCFDPRKDPVIKLVLKPNPAYHETSRDIEHIHQLIWSYHEEIDPRLIYYRLVGESHGNPNAVNPSSGAYGLYQFLGSPYKSTKTHRQIIEAMVAERPDESPRLIQTEYYVDSYLRNFIMAADANSGCNRSKTFSQYTEAEKVAYLGWGSCSQSTLQKEQNT
jgi:hypothetical protein